MTERIVYARAHPEKIKFTERYYYDQEISRNPDVRVSHEPDGLIEVAVPYDGYAYFTRQACDDVERQLGSGLLANRIEALIGHLVLADYGQTDLGYLFELDDHWGSVPLHVPIVNGTFLGGEQLCGDHHTCWITYPYVPSRPEVNPLVNIHNREIWLPNAVNAIYNLTTLFRLPMRQKAIQPSNYEC